MQKQLDAAAKSIAAIAAAQKATRDQKISASSLLATKQATLQQAGSTAVKPAAPAVPSSSNAKALAPQGNSLIAKIGLGLQDTGTRFLNEIGNSLAAVQKQQKEEAAKAASRAQALVASGKVKSDQIVFSQTTKNIQYVLAACSFDPTSIVGAPCGLVDGVLYALQGNGTSAGLSFVGMLPGVAGLAGDTGKAARLAAAARLASITKLITARSIPEFLALADSVKVVGASSATVKVLAGSADEGLEVFTAQTKGWRTVRDIDGVVTKDSLDGIYSMTYRAKSTSPAQAPFTKINATIDVLEYKVVNGIQVGKPIQATEIKFGIQ